MVAIVEWEDMAHQAASMEVEDMGAAMADMEEVWVAMEAQTYDLVKLK